LGSAERRTNQTQRLETEATGGASSNNAAGRAGCHAGSNGPHWRQASLKLFIAAVWGVIFGAFFSALVLGLFLLVLNWTLTGSLKRWLAIGLFGICRC
jgi:hypothetical protein